MAVTSWSLIGHRLSEVTFHSSICSENFTNGKKTKDAVPQIFLWQKHATVVAQPTSTHWAQQSPPTPIIVIVLVTFS